MKKLYKCKDYQNIREVIEHSEENYSEKLAFTIKNKDKTYRDITYKEFLNEVKYLGTAFIEKGFKDERIAVIGKNRYEWMSAYLAVINGTGVVVPLDKALPKNEIEMSIRRAKVTTIVCEEKYVEDLKDIKKSGTTELKNIVCMDEIQDEDILSMKELVENGKELVEKENNRSFIDAKIDNNKMATIIFTSGTTSESKAVVLSHRNIASVIYGLNSSEKIYDTDTNFCLLPFHHTFGSTGLLFILSNGARSVFCDGLRHIQNNMVEYGVSVFIGVPLLIESMDKKIWAVIEKQGKTKLVKTAMKISNALLMLFGLDLRRILFKQIHEQLGGKLRFVVNGAAALNKKVSKDYYSWGFEVVQGYGLTETAPVLTAENKIAFRFGSIGTPMINVELRIDNPDENGIGEIVATGPNVMLEYYENEEATKEVIEVDQDGKRWFHTGDLGYIDKDGFIFITGRKKDMIVLQNGKKVFPNELEKLIEELPYVVESMVFGLPKDDDVVISCKVVYDKNYFKDKTEEEIKDIVWKDIKVVNTKLINFKHIKKIIVTDEPMIKTSTAKIKRYQEVEKIKAELK